MEMSLVLYVYSPSPGKSCKALHGGASKNKVCDGGLPGGGEPAIGGCPEHWLLTAAITHASYCNVMHSHNRSCE